MNDAEEPIEVDDVVAVWGTTEFVPGPDVGLVGHLTFGLIEAGYPGTRDQLWHLVADDAPIDDILDALSANGLKALPSFGLAQVDGEQVRVVARGRTRIAAVGEDGLEKEIDPSGVRTWVEEVLAGVARLSIALVDGDDGADDVVGAGANEAPVSDRFFVLAGSVPASSLVRDFVAADPLAAAAQQGWAPGMPVSDAAAVDDSDSAVSRDADFGPDADPEPAAELVWQASSEPADEKAVEQADALADMSLVVEPDVDAPDEIDEAFRAVSMPVADALPIDSDQTISSLDLDEIDGGPQREPSAGTSGGGADAAASGGDYDFIYGHTVARSVEGAAVRVDESADDGGLISSVPLSTGDVPPSGDHDGQTNPAGRAAAAPQNLAGDHDGLTMSRAQLAALRNAPAAPSLGANEVLAVLCDSRHPNPPQAASCRLCGVALGTARPVSVPRPPLAVLVFSNGDRVVADRSILIGRNPRVTGTATSELPRVVKFEAAGQGLSRTHAEVRIEGWQLLLEDLQSTNGTEVTLPGQTPRRLHAGDPVVLVPGTSIDFGEELTCVVEVAS